MDSIDIVIPWVDNNNPDWQIAYHKYANQSNQRDSNTLSRYRDWDNLQYLFRGIETYMPWVRKVHLVTCGQMPLWLNLNASKLNLVRHEEFIPKEYLPTFSVRPIELNIHRIPDLAEQFIYFNDDFFVLKPMKPTDFFNDGLPVDIAALNVLQTYSPRAHVMANNVILINKYFDKKEVISKFWLKWFKLSYKRWLLKTFCLLDNSFFPGFLDTHLPQPFLKSTFKEVWSQCGERLNDVSSHRFRDISDVNQSLFRYWQIASGKIYAQNVLNYRIYFLVDNSNIEKVVESIRNPRRPIIIINDNDDIREFENVKTLVRNAFEKLLPNKSSFEI